MSYSKLFKQIGIFIYNIPKVVWRRGKVPWRIEDTNNLIDDAGKKVILNKIDTSSQNLSYIPSLLDGGLNFTICNISTFFKLSFQVFKMIVDGHALVFKPLSSFVRKEYKIHLQHQYMEDELLKIIPKSNEGRAMDSAKWHFTFIQQNEENNLFSYIVKVDHVSSYKIEAANRELIVENEAVLMEPVS